MGSRSYRLVCALLCCAVMTAWQLPDALAQEASRQDAHRAREHFKRGRAYHELGKYDNAIKEYLRSYQLSAAPRLLFNVAQAYRLKGARARAVEYYQRYVAAEPRGALADVARGQIETLRRELAEGEDSGSEQVRLSENAPQSERKARRGAEQGRRGKEPGRSRRGQQRKRPQEQLLARDAREAAAHHVHVQRLRTVGMTAGAMGLAALAGGVAYGHRARGIASELEQLPEWEPEHQSRYEQGERANRNMQILYSIGTVALASGGILYYLSRERAGADASASAASAPVLSISTEGVSVSMRF